MKDYEKDLEKKLLALIDASLYVGLDGCDELKIKSTDKIIPEDEKISLEGDLDIVNGVKVKTVLIDKLWNDPQYDEVNKMDCFMNIANHLQNEDNLIVEVQSVEHGNYVMVIKLSESLKRYWGVFDED